MKQRDAPKIPHLSQEYRDIVDLSLLYLQTVIEDRGHKNLIMRRCTVQSCKKIRGNHSDIVLYSLPAGAASDPNWIPILKYGRPNNWKPKKTTAICSDHFHPSDVKGHKILPSAVPFRIKGKKEYCMYKNSCPLLNRDSLQIKWILFFEEYEPIFFYFRDYLLNN